MRALVYQIYQIKFGNWLHLVNDTYPMQVHLFELVVAVLYGIAAQNVRIHQILFDKFYWESKRFRVSQQVWPQIMRNFKVAHKAFHSQVCPSLIQ